MNERRHQKNNDAEQGSLLRQKHERAHDNRADLPRREQNGGLIARLRQAGNSAINWLFGKQGRQLDPQTRAEMERAYNADFSGVRLHQDQAAATAAGALNATAFTAGDDIYLGAESPSPQSQAGRELIAHELAHVAQQRTAANIETGAISQPGDVSELAADQAAQQALHGGTVQVMAATAVPGIQRQVAGRGASRAEVEQAIREFLQRALQAQGGRSIRVTAALRNALMMLANTDSTDWRGPGGDPGRAFRTMNLEIFLSSPALPGDVAVFAQRVARMLPSPFDRTALERLATMPVTDSASPSVMGRIGELVERTAPGSAEREEERQAERIRRGEATGPRIPRRTATDPLAVRPEDQMDRIAQIERAITGREEPTVIGPGSVDLLHLGRIARGLPDTIRGPRRPTRRVEARSFPEVESAIGQVSPDALIPAEARGGADADSFADAREFAAQVARELDVAQQRSQDSITIRLGDNYNQVRDRRALVAEIERIIQMIRDALPHHASNVNFVDVFFGESWATRGRARRSE